MRKACYLILALGAVAMLASIHMAVVGACSGSIACQIQQEAPQ